MKVIEGELKRTRPRLLKTIWTAVRGRGLGEDVLRDIVSQETGRRTSSTKALSDEEAHRILDRLNLKDPDKEAAKRKRMAGRVKRGERKPAKKLARRGGKPRRRKFEEPAGGEKVLRLASDEQYLLLCDLAFQCGLTEESSVAGVFGLATEPLRNWMVRQFGATWKDAGKRRVFSDSLARKAIGALKNWQRNRRRKWTEAHGAKAANMVLAMGLPYSFDQNAGGYLPGPVRRVLEAEEVIAREGVGA